MADRLDSLFSGNNVSSEQFGGPAPMYPASNDYLTLSDNEVKLPDRYYNVTENLAFGTGSVLLGAMETFGSSLSFGVLSDNFVEEYFKGSEFGDFYSRNKDWAKTVGELGTFIIPGSLGMKAVQSGSYLHRAVKALGGGDRLTKLIFTSGEELGTSLKMIENRAVNYAKNTGEINWSRATGPDFWREQASNLTRTAITDSVKKNIAFELGVAATMHTSDTLYPDDWSVVDHIAFNSALPVAGVGLEFFYLRHQLGRIAQNAGEAGIKSMFPGVNFEEMSAVSRINSRDVALTQQQHLIAKLDEAEQNGIQGNITDSERAALRSNIGTLRLSLEGERNQNVSLLAKDKPYPDVTNSWSISDRESRTVFSHLDAAPYDFLGVSSLEAISVDGRAAGDFLSAKKNKLRSLDREIKETREAVEKLGDVIDAPEIEKLAILRRQRKELDQLTPVVLDPFGVKTDARQRGTIFQDYATPRDISQPPGDELRGRKVYIKSTNKDIQGMEISFQDLSVNFGKNSIFEEAAGEIAPRQSGKITSSVKDAFASFQKAERVFETDQTNNLAKGRVTSAKNRLDRAIQKAFPQISEADKVNLFDTLVAGGDEFAFKDIVEVSSGKYFFNGVEVENYAKKYTRTRTPEQEAAISARLASGDLRALGEAGIDDETFYRMASAQNLEQRTALYAGFESAINSIVKDTQSGSMKAPIYINPERHYIYADLAVELHKRLGDAEFARAVALPSNMKIDDVKFIGLEGKWRDFNVWQDIIKDRSNEGRKLTRKLGMNDTNFRYYTNLPQAEPGAVDPILNLFHQLRNHGEKTLKEGLEHYNNLRVAANAGRVAPEKAGLETLTFPLETTGHLLHWKMGENKSVLGVYRQLPTQDSTTYEAMLSRAALHRSDVMNRMANAAQTHGAIIAQTVFDKLNNSFAAKAAANISTLANGSQRGKGHLITRALSVGDSEALRGMDMVDMQLTPVQNQVISDILKSAEYGARASALRSDSVGLQTFADFYNSTRAGWDLTDAPEIKDGRAFFILDNESKRNQRLWQRLYGTELDKDVVNYLPAPTRNSAGYKPLAVTPSALSMIDSIRQIGGQIENETNFILKQTGKGQLTHRNFWIPSLNLSKKHVSFIRDGRTGEMLYVASADDAGELRSIVQRSLDYFAEEGLSPLAIPAVEEGNLFRAMDEAMDRMINFSDPLAQTGGIGGRQKGPVIISGERVLEEVQRATENILQNTFRRNRVLFFEPQINHVRNLDFLNQSTTRATGRTDTSTKQWLNLAHGHSPFDANSPIGKVYTGLEEFMDTKLSWLQSKLTPGQDARLAKRGKAFDEYAKQVGEYNPYTDAVDFAQRTMPVDSPWKSREILSELNQLTTALTLRLFEIGQPILNMVSLAATMPAVVKALQKQGNEDFVQWRRRIGPVGSVLSDESADAVFNPLRLLTSATHNYFNKKIVVNGKEVPLSKWATEQGYFAQSVSDMVENFIAPHQSQARRKLSKFVNYVSRPSDLSESTSRGIAFHAGWQVGETLGIKQNNNLAAFAHDFANKVIGDYRPQNRPMMFQGAVGMPLGLFTTFMWNYNERLFRYIESKSARAFYTQIATQASLFGTQSVPGYQQYVNWFANNYDGTSNPAVGMEERFGTTVADWWHYGLLSNLPKLFGAEDGIAMFQRGDANVKMIPTLFDPTNTPVFNAIRSVYRATSDITSSLRNNGVEPKQIVQILGQHSISRPFRGLVEWAFDQSLDKNGRIINNDVRTTMGTIARLVDMRTLSEAKNMEAFYRLGQSRFARADRLQSLQDSMEFNAREGKYSTEEGAQQLTSELLSYYENGGNPQDFPQVFRNVMIRSVLDRTTLELGKKLSGSVSHKDLEDVRRLIWSQLPVTNLDLEDPE